MATVVEHIGALESYVERHGGRLTRASLPDGVHGRVSRDTIVLRLGLTPEQELVGLVHELAHWLAHHGAASAPGRTICEYEAEAVETVVLLRLGFSRPHGCAGAEEDASPTDHLLRASVARVRWVSGRICEALGLPASPLSEP